MTEQGSKGQSRGNENGRAGKYRTKYRKPNGRAGKHRTEQGEKMTGHRRRRNVQ